MSLSFKDSLEKNIKSAAMETKNVEAAIAVMSVDDMDVNASIMTLDEIDEIVAYAGDDENWIEHRNYIRYTQFSDSNISTVNDKKDISLHENQFNITQEENSQYIPFEMPRYYDGFDLVNTEISICYETSSGRHGHSKPVNVIYNSEKIRFGWLVDAGATVDVGRLKFEIHAYGFVTGSDGETKSYVWKTKSNEKLNVLESFCDNIVNEIDDSWLQELVTDVAEKVAEEIKNVSVGEQVAAAEAFAKEAADSADSAKGYAESASSAATVAVNTIIGDYAKKTYVDEAVAAVDVSEQLQEYVKTSDLENNYYDSTETQEWVNSTLENYATKDDVSDAITEADISDKLNDYYKKTETYSKEEVDDALSNVSVDLSDYATKTYVDSGSKALSSSIETNEKNIGTLSKTVEDLQKEIGDIDKSPRLTYDVAYNDIEDEAVGENVFVFYEIENEGAEDEIKTAKQKFTIVGGGGGSTTSSSLKIGYVTTSPFVVTTTDTAIITYIFSGTDSSGDDVPEGIATWKIAGRTVATNTAFNGENSFDITEYLSVGTQKVNLSITDEAGSLVTKTWTVNKMS